MALVVGVVWLGRLVEPYPQQTIASPSLLLGEGTTRRVEKPTRPSGRTPAYLGQRTLARTRPLGGADRLVCYTDYVLPRSNETFLRLRDWSGNQETSERLAAQIVLTGGFTDVDPGHPRGGPDGGKDGTCARHGERWVMAAYFPPAQVTAAQLKRKLRADAITAQANRAHGMAFVTNQKISVATRAALAKLIAPLPLELFHLDRIVNILPRQCMTFAPSFWGSSLPRERLRDPRRRYRQGPSCRWTSSRPPSSQRSEFYSQSTACGSIAHRSSTSGSESTPRSSAELRSSLARSGSFWIPSVVRSSKTAARSLRDRRRIASSFRTRGWVDGSIDAGAGGAMSDLVSVA